MRIDYKDPDIKSAIKKKMNGIIFHRTSHQAGASYIGDDLYSVDGERKLYISYTEVPGYVKVPFSISLENK